MENAQTSFLSKIGIKKDTLTNPALFIQRVREGISGEVIKKTVKLLDNREVVIRLLGITSGNLSRTYRRKQMSPLVTEEMLDTIRLYGYAIDVFGDLALVKEWMKSPIAALADEKPENLFDTFEGRQWISNVLQKIEYGEFS